MKVIHHISLFLSLIFSVSTFAVTGGVSLIQDDESSTPNNASRGMTLTLIVSSASPSCFGTCDGNAKVRIMGGVPPFQTTWTPGNMTDTIVDNLCAGSYRVRVVDSTGTSVTVNVSIASPNRLQTSAVVTSPACTDEPTVSVGATGGAFPYTGTGTFQSAPGNFVYTVTDSKGCSVTDSIQIVAFTPPTVTITASDTTTLCAGSSINICADATPGTSLLWNTGEISNCIETGYAGGYFVTVTDANNCTAVSNRIEVKVHATPVVSVSMNGDTLKTGDAVNYQWYLNNTEITNANNKMHVARSVGSYNVAVTDVNGCTARSADVYVSNLQNNITTGIGELKDDGVLVHTNPSVNGNWTITVSSDLVGATVNVMDNNGKLVFSSFASQQEVQLNVNASSTGIYLLHIRSGNQDITRKLIRL